MDSVKIGPLFYDIIYTASADDEFDGKKDEGSITSSVFAPDQATIFIDNGLDWKVKHLSLWHEVIHAILSQNGYFEDTVREDLVTVIANGVANLIQDNPCICDMVGLENLEEGLAAWDVASDEALFSFKERLASAGNEEGNNG